MNDFDFFRRLLQNMVYFVVLDANNVLKHSIIPGYYIQRTKTIHLASTLNNEEMVKATYAALVHHLHPNNSLETCMECAKEIATKIPRSEMRWSIRYIKSITSRLSLV